MNRKNDECTNINIRIKPSGNEYKDITINIPLSYTVHQLKEKIRSSCFNQNNCVNHESNNNVNHSSPSSSNSNKNNRTISKDRYLRLVCSGRLLAPDSTNITDFKCIKDGSVIHAVLAAPGIRLVNIYICFVYCFYLDFFCDISFSFFF
jgi:hypothetical protein